MKLFTITIGPRSAPRIVLDVMAPDAFTAREQHEDLAQPGERVEVAPVPSEQEKLQADLDYLHDQQARERRRLTDLTQWEMAFDRMQGLVS